MRPVHEGLFRLDYRSTNHLTPICWSPPPCNVVHELSGSGVSPCGHVLFLAEQLKTGDSHGIVTDIVSLSNIIFSSNVPFLINIPPPPTSPPPWYHICAQYHLHTFSTQPGWTPFVRNYNSWTFIITLLFTTYVYLEKLLAYLYNLKASCIVLRIKI